MPRVDAAWDAWVELVAELVGRPASPAMPQAQIEALLGEQFAGRASWHEIDLPGPGGTHGVRRGPTGHPLARWHLDTGAVAQDDGQMTIPCLDAAEGFWFFLLRRRTRDFEDDEVAHARRIQPLLQVLARRALHARRAAAEADRFGLTERELVVLDLLGQGYTAKAIAHRLGTAPTTVRKHLENAYRKLGVNDRLMAYRVAQTHGLLPRRDA